MSIVLVGLISGLLALVAGVALGAAWARSVARGNQPAREVSLRESIARLEADSAAKDTTVEALRSEASAASQEAAQIRADLARASATLEQERLRADEKLSVLEDAQAQLTDAFDAMSARALEQNNKAFLDLARTSLEAYQAQARTDLSRRQDAVADLVKPLHERLERVDEYVRDLERSRKQAYGELTAQVTQLGTSQKELQDETRNLVTALRRPHARGRWGELQLKRVVELAGMVDHCDFVEQVSADTDEGRLRPDMLVSLPGGGQVVIDAKAPLEAYLDATEATDPDVRATRLADHARAVRSHVAALSAKAYWEQFSTSPDLVVLFLPGESFFADALAHDPSLIEDGVARQVILATPTTLIALLRSVAYGWRQEALAENAEAVAALGRELHERLAVFADHLASLRKGLQRSVESYNKAVGSFESRVLVSARKFEDLGVVEGNALDTADPVELTARALQAPEISGEDDPSIVELHA